MSPRRYAPYHQQSARPSKLGQANSQWWRPFTRWWGIFGVLIFIGIVMSLVDHSARLLRAKQTNELSGKQITSTTAAQVDQSPARSNAREATALRRPP
jgi:hypothetical protein